MKKPSLILLCLVSCMHMQVFAQSVYTLDLRNDLIIAAVSLSMGIIPFFVNNEPDQVPGILNRNDVNNFDRPLMYAYNRNLDLFSDNVVYGLALLPIISVIPNIRHPNTALTYGVMYGQAALLTYGTAFTLKGAVIRNRPYMYDSGIPSGKGWDYHNSFPSAATSFAFLSATFLSVTYSGEFPESRWKYPVILGSYTVAAGIAAMRVYAGSHFVSDVLVGAMIGSVFGGLIPLLHVRNSNDTFTLVPQRNGIAILFRY